MGKKIFGRVVDEQNKAVEFATVFLSDVNGKPITPSKNTTTDTKGTFTLDNLNDSDYVTVRYVGLTPKTVQVKSAINIPMPSTEIIMPTLLIKMMPDISMADLQEVVVTAKPIPKTKKDNTLRNILIISGVFLLLSGITYVVIQSKTAKAR